jgi:hypothetical protein
MTDALPRVPGAAQHLLVVRCRTGTVAISGDPGSAVHRHALHRVRDTMDNGND